MIALVACKSGSGGGSGSASGASPGDGGVTATRPADPPVAADAGAAVAAAADAGRPIPPDLIPSGAHAQYPTARRAGTADLFFIEEPVRGPHVTHVDKPPRRGLTFSRHGHCSVTGTGLACGATPPERGDKVEVKVGRTADGKPVLVEWKVGGRVDSTAILTYNDAGQITQLARLDDVDDITYVRTYDPPGKRYTARKLDGANHLDGCGAYDLGLDAAGRVINETCLQWLGDPMRDTNGVTTTRYQRDDDGFVTREERFGAAGAPIAGVRDAVARIDTERDDAGRVKVERFYDVNGKATPSAEERGCYAVGYEYEHGQEVRRRCLNADGSQRRDTDGVATFESVRDRRGCKIEARHLGAGGELVLRDGIASYEYKVDNHCRTIVSACVDRDGDRTACAAGEPAVYKYKLDRHGRTVSATFLDTDGEPTVDGDYGATEVRYEYDALGRQTAESCHGEHGVNLQCAETGFHRNVDAFDDNGRISSRRFVGPDGEVATNRGTLVREYIYDNYDHLVETRNRDEDGDLLESDGMAIKRNYYDDTHRLFGLVLLDAQGAPSRYDACFTGVKCPALGQPWHAVRVVRSPDGRPTHNHYFDHDGKLIMTLDCRQEQCWGGD